MIRPDACDLVELGISPTMARRIYAVQPAVESAASMHGVPPVLVNAVIWVESRFRPDAVSPAGARGLMQLMPATSAAMAKRHDLPDAPFDPRVNVHLGTLYLAMLLRRWDGNVDLAAASYYAGAGRVARAGGVVPPVAAGYVRKVRNAVTLFSAIHARCRGEPVPMPSDMLPSAPVASRQAPRTRAAPRPARPTGPAPVVASAGGGGAALLAIGALLAMGGGMRWL